MSVAQRSKASFRLGAVKPGDHDEAGGKASIGVGKSLRESLQLWSISLCVVTFIHERVWSISGYYYFW
jgi:hypothetical protein